jgi:hypothetical protein
MNRYCLFTVQEKKKRENIYCSGKMLNKLHFWASNSTVFKANLHLKIFLLFYEIFQLTF